MKSLLRIENLLLLAPILFGLYSVLYFTQSSDPDLGFETGALVSLTISFARSGSATRPFAFHI
jgi:hypothetical protein